MRTHLFHLFLFLLIATSSLSQSVSPKISTAFGASSSYFKHKLNRYLFKDSALHQHISLFSNSLAIYKDGESKQANKPEFELAYHEIPAFVWMIKNLPIEDALAIYLSKGSKNLLSLVHPTSTTNITYKGSLPLSGVRIAIDPGHLGGQLQQAELEYRYVKLNDSIVSKKTLLFCEGNLAQKTAFILASMLQKAGAEVLITKDKEGNSSFGSTFAEWKKKELIKAVDKAHSEEKISDWKARQLKTRASDAIIFHSFFKFLDMRNRARIINEFAPHVAVVLHFNADEKNKRDNKGFFRATKENSNMAFVPGAFMNKELDDAHKRMLFLFKLVSDQVEKSIALSEKTVHAYSLKLGALEPENSERNYLKHMSLPTGARAVYCRNLTLSREIHFPIVYGETLFQDNLKEARQLSNNNVIFQNQKVPKRLIEVAETYYDGILNYIETYHWQ